MNTLCYIINLKRHNFKKKNTGYGNKNNNKLFK
jgi:hypothetical protein